MKKKLALLLAASLSICGVARAFFNVILNGQTYLIPAKGDTGYSQGVNSLDAYLQALPGGLIQTSGGTMTGNLTLGNGASVVFTSPSLTLWPVFVDNNGNISVLNLASGTTTFAILNSTSAIQAGNPTIFLSSGTINAFTGQTVSVATVTAPNVVTTTITFNDGTKQTSAGAALASTQTFTGSDSFTNLASSFTVTNSSISLNGLQIVANGSITTGGTFTDTNAGQFPNLFFPTSGGGIWFGALNVFTSGVHNDSGVGGIDFDTNSTHWINLSNSGNFALQGAAQITVSTTSRMSWGGGVSYRPPGLVFVSTNAVTVQTGQDGTAVDAPLIFPDGRVIISTATPYQTVFASTTWSNVGFGQSGVAIGTAAVNTWYSFYGVETNTNQNWVLVASTWAPVQSNFASLNTAFTANQWKYVGTGRYGDQGGTSTGWLKFVQHGDTTVFANSNTGGILSVPGIRLVTASGVGSVGWAYASGMAGAVVPPNILEGFVGFTSNAAATSATRLEQDSAISGNNRIATLGGNGSVSQGLSRILAYLQNGLGWGLNAATASGEVYLDGFIDSVLAAGNNPMF